MWVEDFAPGARKIRRGSTRVYGRSGSRLTGALTLRKAPQRLANNLAHILFFHAVCVKTLSYGARRVSVIAIDLPAPNNKFAKS